MPTHLYRVLGHIHRPKSIFHTQSLHRNPTPQIPPKWFWKLLTDFLVCSVSQPIPLPATQDRPFYPSPGRSCCLWVQCPLLGKTKCRKSAAGTLQKQSLHTWPPKALQRVPAPANIATRLPVSHVKGWHLNRGQPCLMSRALLSVLNSLSLCPNRRCWHCLLVLWKFLAWMLLMLCILSGPSLLIFSWSSIASLSCRLLTQVHETSHKRPKWRKPCFPQSHSCNQQTWLCPFICP